MRIAGVGPTFTAPAKTVRGSRECLGCQTVSADTVALSGEPDLVPPDSSTATPGPGTNFRLEGFGVSCVWTKKTRSEVHKSY